MTETAPALRTTNAADQIALRGVRLRCRLAGMTAHTTLEQTFVNLEPKAIEAVYTFPLPEGAAVCGFEVIFFDKIFTGVVEENDKAIEKYDDAIGQGHGAYLLEQNRPDVFTIRVGNLKPRQAVTIRLTYVEDAQIVDRQIRLAFPTTIAPRYVTSSGMDPVDAAIDGDALNPPHVLSVPYGLSMEVEIDLDTAMERVTSPSHAIEASRRDGVTLIKLAGGLTEMNRDIVVAIELMKESAPFALSAVSKDNERFIALNFIPEFSESDLDSPNSTETVFVLDCSGSMQGDSIQQAVAALECCLRSMSAGDCFNIVRFGSSFDMLSPEPVVYSQETLNRALAYVHRGADLGGTELLAPLEAIFNTRPARGEARNLVLLTDGQVSNEPAVLALAKRKRSRNRIFTFGIGSACSRFLVQGLARVTSGAAEFITAGERIEDKVLRTFGRIGSPPVSDVEIDFGGAEAEQAPRVAGPIFDGDVLRVFARVRSSNMPETVTLKCATPRGPRSWSIKLRDARDAANVLPTFWARAMIRAIEEGDDAAILTSTSTTSESRDTTRLISLSKQYNLLCGQTSFIAIEHRSLEDRNEGRPELRRVPVMLADGWGAVEGDTRVVYACAAPMAAPPAPSLANRRSRSGAIGSVMRSLGKMFGGGSGGPADGMNRLSATPSIQREKLEEPVEALFSGDDGDDAGDDAIRGAPAADDLVTLLAAQQADGSFKLTAAIEKLLADLGVSLSTLRASAKKRAGDAPESVIHTLAALAALKSAFASRQAAWKRAAKKAVGFVVWTMNVHVNEVNVWIESIVST